MFERYTEKARRVIFFARYEASQFGSPYIETEHILLGLLREDKALTNRFLRSHASVESIRKQIEEHTIIREKVSTSVDLPLSDESKRVLAFAAEEAERLGHKHIGTEHLLLGLLREENNFAARILKERRVNLNAVREELARSPNEPQSRGAVEPNSPIDFSRDFTQAAMEGQLFPVVSRDQELDGVVEILSSCRKQNPVLIGERGSGKTAVVELLAQLIAEGAVPSFLTDKRILAFDAQLVASWARDRLKFEQRLNQIIAKALVDSSEPVVLFIDELRPLSAAGPLSALAEVAGILKSALLQGKIQCIGASTPSDYQESVLAAPWLEDCFRAVFVRPLDEEATLRVLEVRKHHFEEFHGVTYADEALECASRSSDRYLPEQRLPGKALELLDAAGARVKLRQAMVPVEVAESQKRIHFIVRRMDSAIANHEFEKANFYSEEERKERENLRVLREKLHIEDVPSSLVSREDIEEVISRWAAYPFRP